MTLFALKWKAIFSFHFLDVKIKRDNIENAARREEGSSVATWQIARTQDPRLLSLQEG